MNVLIHKRNKTDDKSVSFPNLQCWNPVTRVATIAAQVNGDRVSCRIKIDDLNKRFNIESDEPMQAVIKYRTEIEKAARELIEKRTFESDGSIAIAFKDL